MEKHAGECQVLEASPGLNTGSIFKLTVNASIETMN